VTAELIPLGEALRTLGPPEREPVLLDKEDDVAHAEQALLVLRNWYSTTSVTQPVYYKGQWYYYRQGTGTWVMAPDSTAQRCVLELRNFVRHPVRGQEGGRRMRMSNGKHESVYKMMKKMATDDEFFDEAPACVSFANDTTVVFASGPHKKTITSGYSPTYRCRSFYNFKFDPAGGCPNWLAFLDSVFLHDEDKEEKVQVLREFLGAAMRGDSCSYERVLMLLGAGSNGKSIFCTTVAKLFEGQMCAVPPQDMSNEKRVVALEGKSLNMVSDIPIRGFNDSGGFKQVTSGEQVEGWVLYHGPVMVHPRAAHIFSANDLPRSPDVSDGFYRRWIIVSFNRRFSGENSTPKEVLLERLERELPGIAMWALEGSGDLRNRKGGFLLPRTSKLILEEWSAANNMAQQFVMQACRHVKDGEHWIRATELYAAYKEWSKHNGHMQMSSTVFYQRLKALHYKRRRESGLGTYVYNLAVLPKQLWHGRVDEDVPQQEDLLK
jgi:P4 family phage/plasmid primase-like protien